MNEVLDDFFAAPSDGLHLTAQDVLLHLTVAFILGQLVAWVYMWTHRGVSYSRSHVQSLILLSLIVTTVMLAIGNNMARAFGLFGALALIRFRTPVKDTRDTAFLFLAVGIGISVGSRNLMLASIGTVFALAVVVYMTVSRFGQRMSGGCVLRFVMAVPREGDASLKRILRHYCRSFSLLHLRDAGPSAATEFAYQLHLHDEAQSPGLLEDVRRIPGVTDISLLLQDEDEEP